MARMVPTHGESTICTLYVCQVLRPRPSNQLKYQCRLVRLKGGGAPCLMPARPLGRIGGQFPPCGYISQGSGRPADCTGLPSLALAYTPVHCGLAGLGRPGRLGRPAQLGIPAQLVRRAAPANTATLGIVDSVCGGTA
eukprot:gene15820-biopygen695